MPEFIDPVFAKTSQKRSFSVFTHWKRAFWARFRVHWVYKFGHRYRSQEINSASLCNLAGRYDNHIPKRFLAPIDCFKIPAVIYSTTINTHKRLLYAEFPGEIKVKEMGWKRHAWHFWLRVRQLPGELRGENRIEEVLEKNDKQGRDLSLEILHQDRLLYCGNIPKGIPIN